MIYIKNNRVNSTSTYLVLLSEFSFSVILKEINMCTLDYVVYIGMIHFGELQFVSLVTTQCQFYLAVATIKVSLLSLQWESINSSFPKKVIFNGVCQL